MEKRVNQTVETYVIKFKEDVKTKLAELDFSEKEKLNDLLEFLNEYDRLVIQKEDLVKRNRQQNNIPSFNRCIAKLQNGDQCTRQKKDKCLYCGTHTKSTPFGCIEDDSDTVRNKKFEVVAHEIKGIIYYLDSENNVYRTEDILANISNPRILAKATLENGQYRIPLFNI